jgi:hypothetical protein
MYTGRCWLERNGDEMGYVVLAEMVYSDRLRLESNWYSSERVSSFSLYWQNNGVKPENSKKRNERIVKRRSGMDQLRSSMYRQPGGRSWKKKE